MPVRGACDRVAGPGLVVGEGPEAPVGELLGHGVSRRPGDPRPAQGNLPVPGGGRRGGLRRPRGGCSDEQGIV